MTVQFRTTFILPFALSLSKRSPEPFDPSTHSGQAELRANGKKHRAPIALASLLCLFACIAHADIFRPAYLELRETGADRYDVLWKVPAQGDLRLAVSVRFPPDTVQLSPPQGVFISGAYVERWRIQHPGGLVGQSIRVEGVAGGVTDVIVRVERQDGATQVERLVPADPQFVVKAPAGTGEIAWSYLVLGVEHILGGVDHLLFVLALLLIVRGGQHIVLTITAFTIAHTITLISATLGWVHVPGPPVEALIALSIVFVAAEIVQGLRGKAGVTARAPWLVAFSFGLLHGLGFAGALAEVGLPPTSIPVALLTFNVGVELGQLIFVACALGVAALLKRSFAGRETRLQFTAAYVIGSVAMLWAIERIAAFA